MKVNRCGSEENKKKEDMPPKDVTRKIGKIKLKQVLNLNMSNKKISPKLDKTRKDNSGSGQNTNSNQGNIGTQRQEKNAGTKINLRKLK